MVSGGLQWRPCDSQNQKYLLFGLLQKKQCLLFSTYITLCDCSFICLKNPYFFPSTLTKKAPWGQDLDLLFLYFYFLLSYFLLNIQLHLFLFPIVYFLLNIQLHYPPSPSGSSEFTHWTSGPGFPVGALCGILPWLPAESPETSPCRPTTSPAPGGMLRVVHSSLGDSKVGKPCSNWSLIPDVCSSYKFTPG